MSLTSLTKSITATALFLAVFLLPFAGFAQSSYTSRADGDWNTITWNPAGTPGPSDDVTISNNVTIAVDEVVKINNLNIDKNSKLTVYGTLIVHGTVDMDNNGAEFSMQASAFVNIYGDFNASNQVDISVSSYLIIQGNFTKKGAASDKQGSLNVDDGHIYIFGDVDPDWTNFDGCGGSYDGDTTDEQVETCDYGNDTALENNIETFPPEIREEMNCFNIGELQSQQVCENGSLSFSTKDIANVDYQWQKRSSGGSWTNVGTNSSSYSITSATAAMDGDEYRVVLRAGAGFSGTCNIVISNPATLTVLPQNFSIGSITGPTALCLPATNNLTYNIPAVEYGQYTWTVPTGWTVITGQGSESITVQPDNTSGIKLISVEVTLGCGNSKTSTIQIQTSREGEWTGAKDTNWNDIANWGCGILPTIDTDVLIPSGLTNYPVLSSGVAGEAKDLTIEAGASLKVTGNALKLAGVVSANSNLDALSGKIVFAGTTAQIIPSGTFLNNRIKDLSIDNLAGVTSEGILEITGILKASSGNFNTGDQLTLISDNLQTALIDGSGNGEILGSVTMQRYLDTAFGYKYFSTPFSNSTVGDFSSFVDLSASFPNFYSYNENRKDGAGNDATGWESYTNPSGSMEAGAGYALNFGNGSAPTTVEISGSVNNGPVSIALQNHNGLYTKGFQLVGNPYPSPIDWNATGWTKNNIDDGIYFFTAGTTDQYTGTYTSYVNGVSSADGKSSNIIPSMQGFFVKVRDAVSGESYPINATLGMTNAVRVNDFDQPFLKKAETPKPLLRLTADFGAKEQQDAMVIYFSPYSSLKFEQEKDAHKLMNTDVAVPNLYSISSDKKELSINAVPMPVSGGYEKIPLGIKAERSGRMTIKLADLENLGSNFNVYLIDHQRNIGQNLSKKNNYSFEVQEGTWNSRFELMFSEEKMKDPAIAFDEPFSVEMQNTAVVVKLNLENGQQGIVTVSSISGQVLQSRKGNGKDEVVFEGITSDGVYIINLDLGQERFSKKVLKK